MDIEQVLSKVTALNINIDTKSAEKIGESIKDAKIRESENDLEAIKIREKYLDEQNKREFKSFYFGAIAIPFMIGFTIFVFYFLIKKIPI